MLTYEAHDIQSETEMGLTITAWRLRWHPQRYHRVEELALHVTRQSRPEILDREHRSFLVGGKDDADRRLGGAEVHRIGDKLVEQLKEDIGPDLAQDLTQLAGSIYAGLPVRGSDTGDYLVRNLVGLDPNQGVVAIAGPPTM